MSFQHTRLSEKKYAGTVNAIFFYFLRFPWKYSTDIVNLFVNIEDLQHYICIPIFKHEILNFNLARVFDLE